VLVRLGELLMSAAITLWEVAPRDGFQPVAPFIPTATKIEAIEMLAAAGLRRQEVSSFVAPRAVPQLADAAQVLAAARNLPGMRACVLAPNRRGVELALAHRADRIGLFMSVTESHNRSNVNRPVEESFADLARLVAEIGDRAELRFNLSCSFHCPFEGVVPEAATLSLIARVAALRPGLEIGVADTTGNAAPDQVFRVFSAAIAVHPDARFAFHGHDTYGLGLANVAAAYRAGVRIFDAAAGGIGGCPFAPGATGNVATEDVAWMFARMGVATGVDLASLLQAADAIVAIPGVQPGGRVRVVPALRRAA
jgi:hydroxymethylglutaryl-CoA lyase